MPSHTTHPGDAAEASPPSPLPHTEVKLRKMELPDVDSALAAARLALRLGGCSPGLLA